jgi:LEA14-like dessication related protein
MFNNKVRNFLFLLIFILLPMSTGCSLLSNRPRTPIVNIAEVRLKELKTLEAVFSVQLRVINPNDFSFVVKDANCDFSINDVHLATGVTDNATEIPASGTAFLTVDIYSSVFNVLKCVRSLSDKKICRYKAKGKLNLDAKHSLPLNLPFDSEGELDIKELLGKN